MYLFFPNNTPFGGNCECLTPFLFFFLILQVSYINSILNMRMLLLQENTLWNNVVAKL